MIKTIERVVLVAVALLVTAPLPAFAQNLYGSLVGNVVDASQAAVAGATVTVTSVETGAVRTATTNLQGVYNMPNLLNGRYTVEVRKEGFRVVRQEDVSIGVNTVTRADFELAVGQVVESVTVEASAVGLQTDRSEVRAEIT
ncbi:MAG: carboxypeptidase-like regulatory domain-containing protein, partial [Bryobacteraceae bacterium]